MNLKFLLVRTILETKSISQRGLAKKFFVSLGKINSLMKELIDDEIISLESEGHYRVSEKGKSFVKKNKVDSAVIFACKTGVKISAKYSQIPICFLEINGKRLIERQIEQLKEAGIDDINIMVGFMKEKFDYLIDKYDVKLHYNEEYQYKNTLSTLYHSKDLIKNKNVYICVSDVYIEQNPYHKYEIEPYYTGVFFEDCKNEWRFVTNSKNEIKDVVVGGTNDFCLVGPSFLTKEFGVKLIKLIDEYYHKTFTDNYYWEDVLVQNFDNLPTMYLYKLGKKGIIEFDTLKDVEDFNKYNMDFDNKILDYVSGALKVGKKEIKDIECIKESVANIIYRFSIDSKEYVIRVPKENSNEFINRHNEASIIKKLPNDITEEVVHFDTKNGYKIAKYIKPIHSINTKNWDDLRKCMAIYKKLHTSGVEVDGSCDIIYMIKQYLSIIKKNDIKIPYEDFDQMLCKARDIKEFIESEKRPKTICHGDPNPQNILVLKDGLKLIEFEYGGMADPISDIALFGAYEKFDTKKTYELYKIYKECEIEGKKNYKNIIPKDDDIAKKLLVSYMALAGFYNALWAIVRGELSNADYGTFGMDGYRTFKNCKP